MDVLQDILQDISQDMLLYLYRLPPSVLPDPVVWGKHSGGDRVTVTCRWFPSVELSVQDGCSDVSGLAVASSFLLTPQVDTSHDWHVEGGNARRILCVCERERQCLYQLHTPLYVLCTFLSLLIIHCRRVSYNKLRFICWMSVCVFVRLYVRAPWATPLLFVCGIRCSINKYLLLSVAHKM